MDETPKLVALPIVQIIHDAVMPPKRQLVDDDLDAVYPIVEMFHSVQGEGFHAGTAAATSRARGVTPSSTSGPT